MNETIEMSIILLKDTNKIEEENRRLKRQGMMQCESYEL